MLPRLLSLFAAIAAFLLGTTGCETTSGMNSGPTEAERATQIAAEPPGNYWIGRRYFITYCHLWGYVRRPREPWSTAKLVILDESSKLAPDRLPEEGPLGAKFGFDQNYEYKLTGNFTGSKSYDPNSNLILPVFHLTDYSLINRAPGWIFQRGESHNSTRLPRSEPEASMW